MTSCSCFDCICAVLPVVLSASYEGQQHSAAAVANVGSCAVLFNQAWCWALAAAQIAFLHGPYRILHRSMQAGLPLYSDLSPSLRDCRQMSDQYKKLVLGQC